MECIGSKLQKQGVIMALFTLGLMNTGCEERIDHPQVSGDKKVDVSLSIGFADEVDGYTLSASSSTKSATKQGVFDYDLQPSLQTKSTGVKPDKLYNLEIQQYDRSGTRIGGMSSAVTQEIGSALTLTLAEAVDCQLVLVAWGEGNTKTLGTKSLADAQKVSLDASVVKNLDPVSGMNKMPYVLHLEHVNVTKDGTNGTNGIISSPEDKDVRLLLQRLASRLTLEWKYSYTGYTLKQILLESIPLNYNVVAQPDNDKTYPSLLDQFTTIQLTEAEIATGSYSCWIPANVRGSSSSATSQTYRIKSNAPIGSAYASFIAVNQTENKKKLNYRVYLGCNNSSDFNLYSNTDYNYVVNINHDELPVDDRRVTIIDPIPASQNNENLVPTANCFMVAPGSAFCFDPFKYQKNGDRNNVNTLLKGWSDTEGGIAYVKLLWQTKENGDVGDPVMGVVNSESDHTNIVDFKNNLIYCRVAPNTTGGNGLIAAYNSANDILWSWHIWVTDYAPTSTGDETVLTPVNKRKLKFTHNSSDQPPMMDRNLGAIKGYTLSDPPQNVLDMSKANGLHYQWGRKDPFAGSYSAISIGKITGLTSATIAPKGMLNRYGPDGISYLPLITETSRQTLRNTYKRPTDYIMLDKAAYGWCADNVSVIKTLWNDENNLKGLNDPCPAGWRVVSGTELGALAKSGSIYGQNVTPNAANPNSAVADGGLYLYFQNEGSGEASYFRFPGYRRTVSTFEFIGLRCIIWQREYSAASVDRYYSNGLDMCYNDREVRELFGIAQSFSIQDGQVTRCIQEQR